MITFLKKLFEPLPRYRLIEYEDGTLALAERIDGPMGTTIYLPIGPRYVDETAARAAIAHLTVIRTEDIP